MAARHEHPSEQRRFLVINFWVGSHDNGYLAGPVLVSTADFERFHFWDELSAAMLEEDEYQIVKLYPRGLTYDQATQQFAQDFPPTTAGPCYSGVWIIPNGGFYDSGVGEGRSLHVA